MSDTDRTTQLETENAALRALVSGPADYRDDSLPLPERVRLAEKAGAWSYAGTLKRQIDAQNANASRIATTIYARGDIDALQQEIAELEQAGEYRKAGHLKREIQSLAAKGKKAMEHERVAPVREAQREAVAAKRKERSDLRLAIAPADNRESYGHMRRATGRTDIRGVELP